MDTSLTTTRRLRVMHYPCMHNCKVHVRHGCIGSFEELEPADAEQRKALYGLLTGGEGDDRRAVTLQLKLSLIHI